MNVDRSYVFRLSAPTAVTEEVITAASAGRMLAEKDGTSQKKQTATGSTERESNRVEDTTPSTMLPPASLGERTKQKIGDDSDGPSKTRSQVEVTGSKASISDVEAEREAMQKANLPSTFGAVRDKPLGKRVVREAHIMRGVAGVSITATGDRFATGLGIASNRDVPASKSTPDGEIVDKAEARKKREAEIAALTAELSRQDPDDAGVGREEGGKSASESVKFIPGGWRHASTTTTNSKGISGRRKRDGNEESKVISMGDGRLPEHNDDMEEDEPMEEEEEEEEEMTEEMRIKMIVRRLGLPVSHEIQLSGHRKGVMALALDRAGGRVATGSNDYKV